MIRDKYNTDTQRTSNVNIFSYWALKQPELSSNKPQSDKYFFKPYKMHPQTGTILSDTIDMPFF